jgi:CRP-like cAMP-binding protein
MRQSAFVTLRGDAGHTTYSMSSLISDQLFAEEWPMALYTAPIHLQTVLEQQGQTISKPKASVLFRRGEKASGVFLVLSGRVSLDFGVDSAFARSYGPGALVGLPATLTGRNYAMTATVTEDAELVLWTPEALSSLLRNRPDFCRELLEIWGEKMAENQKVAKALLTRDEHPLQQANVV